MKLYTYIFKNEYDLFQWTARIAPDVGFEQMYASSTSKASLADANKVAKILGLKVAIVRNWEHLNKKASQNAKAESREG